MAVAVKAFRSSAQKLNLIATVPFAELQGAPLQQAEIFDMVLNTLTTLCTPNGQAKQAAEQSIRLSLAPKHWAVLLNFLDTPHTLVDIVVQDGRVFYRVAAAANPAGVNPPAANPAGVNPLAANP